ncbi:MAG TPA: acetoacetate--CoA ligase [Steroidobacteraceae bacterium]|jgi:acetoacetyl-CoA synthetase
MPELWRPTPSQIADANLTRFMSCVNSRRGTAIERYADLYTWSIEYPEQFWVELTGFADIRAQWGTGPVLDNPQAMPGARFFPDALLNFAENLLRYRDDQPAIVFHNERGQRRELSYRTLSAEVARVAAGLKALDVKSGDRVAAFMPNLPQTVIAMLAATSLGAIWSSCSPDFGVQGVLDRFGQIAPKVLFAADGYTYGGKPFDSLGPLTSVLTRLPSIEHVVLVPYLAAAPDIATLRKPTTLWESFGTPGTPLEFVQTAFNHPVYILYSSGTTGAPKCIVHGAGGTLLQHQKEHLLHTDLKRADRVFYFTTCGWMMWNWLASALAVGSTLVLFDGNPFHPDPSALWKMAEEEQVTVFGTSAKYISAMQKAGLVPRRDRNLPALRAILSTGSPLLPDGFDYVYESIKPNVQLASISGGTDIVSCFALGCPILPVNRGELQCRGLGMAVEIFNDAGQPVRGQQGELVCTRPFPAMPVGFWNDPDGRKYHAAYFDRFPGIWHHGDFAELTEHDGIIIYGRSDAVLNPGGVRIGTAEIYGAVESIPEVVESLAVGQNWHDDVRIVLFVRLEEAVALDEALRKRIRDTIRSNTTQRHVPAKIIEVADIPRTFSGKLSELAVHNVIHGKTVKNTDALANPCSLALFRDLPDLQS